MTKAEFAKDDYFKICSITSNRLKGLDDLTQLSKVERDSDVPLLNAMGEEMIKAAAPYHFEIIQEI